MSTTILSVKVVGFCSKHRPNNEAPIKNKYDEVVPDKDIKCIECSFEDWEE